jgi:pilus assembly protein FimV
VSLKDDQIAALQNALAESAEVEMGDKAAADSVEPPAAAEQESSTQEPTQAAAQPVAQPATQPQAERPAPPAKPTPAADGTGTMSYLWYGRGARVLGILGFLFLRRRGRAAEEESFAAVAAPPPAEDVFADVELKEQRLAPAEEAELTPEPSQETPQRDTRGYGEQQNDEYSADIEAGDALAEADIYIAYGRYPQAIDLLRNAIGNEPNNPAYRLKLLEMYVDMDDQGAATAELEQLQAINDPDSLARADEIMAAAGLAPAVDAGEPFTGLEIEELRPDTGSAAQDLDPSADFSDNSLGGQGEEEDLVIAAEANGLSTKLDLARAYLDMGDEDGAREILQEVAVEGDETQKAEADALLGRIG